MSSDEEGVQGPNDISDEDLEYISDGSDSYVDLEGSMDLSDVDNLEESMENSLDITSSIDDCTMKAPLKELVKLSCLR